jgi:branched-chain amino acid transport system substrate-binding protein
MIRRPGRLTAILAAGAMFLAACGDDDDTAEPTVTTAAPTDDGSPETTEPTDDGTDTTEPAEDGWVVDLADCVDPDAAEEPIEGTVKIGTVLPLSGGVAAVAFSPVNQGLSAYFEYANENDLLPGYTIELTVADDQYSKDLTPGAVDGLLDQGVHLFTGIIGTPNNQAVRDTLNEECVPQLLSLTGAPYVGGDPEGYPWTTISLVPYDVEAKTYATRIAEEFPDGASVALFTVNTEFGDAYVEAFEEIAAELGIEVAAKQTIEATDAAPPAAQLNAIAGSRPDAILAVPLGSQCPSFLTELANTKAANAGWDPQLYLTNTCASSLILGAAGPAADGLFTSNHLKDVNRPEVAAEEGVIAYLDFMNGKGYGDVVTTASAGWTVGEVTVAILRQAAESPEGLTRASIMNAARNLAFTPTLARDGVVFTTDGLVDPFYVQSLQVLQYSTDSGLFSDIGDLITQFDD